jgi:hypothetical protein
MPTFSKSKLGRGQTDSMSTDKMMAVRWMDRREVCMLTTLHSDAMRQTGKQDRHTKQQIEKPHCVIDYNKNMGAVDRTDMMITSIECIRKSLKWYRKFFLHLLDITVLNSYTLFNVKTGNNISLADFQLQLIRQIIQNYHIPRQTSKRGRPSDGDQPLRLSERHFPSPVPPTPKKMYPSRQCHVCSNTTTGERRRRESRYMCAKCNVGLCVHPCFEKYHTLLNF